MFSGQTTIIWNELETFYKLSSKLGLFKYKHCLFENVVSHTFPIKPQRIFFLRSNKKYLERIGNFL